MKFLFSFLFFLLIYTTPVSSHTSYPYNDQVPIELWNFLEPYFLPSHHPIRIKLDSIFKKRVTLSKETFERAGFKLISERPRTNVIVAKHPALKGYILKLLLDEHPNLDEWQKWVPRIEGARLIREVIKTNNFVHFNVPKKWIYPLPKTGLSANNLNPKHFILIAEEMNLLSFRDNKNAYKERITPKMLDELFFLLSDCGLLDSVYIDNIPFDKSGKICFIDTEHYQKWPVRYDKLLKAFSPKMQIYWKRLISSEDNKK